MTRQSIVICTLVLLLCLGAASQASADSGAAAREIGRILDLFEKAYLDEDIELMASVMSDRGYALIMTRADDPSTVFVFGKNEALQAISRRFDQVDYLEHKHVDRLIKVSGPMATSVSTIVDRMDTGQTLRTPIYHIFAREDEGWRVVFSSNILFTD
jgi:hypothetical protein